MSTIRRNKGKHKLLACVSCEKCRETLYPDDPELTKYRVREVSPGFMQTTVFLYSHVDCGE